MSHLTPRQSIANEVRHIISMIDHHAYAAARSISAELLDDIQAGKWPGLDVRESTEPIVAEHIS